MPLKIGNIIGGWLEGKNLMAPDKQTIHAEDEAVVARGQIMKILQHSSDFYVHEYWLNGYLKHEIKVALFADIKIS